MIEIYGWSDALQRTFAPYAAQGYAAGRITVQQRGSYTVVTDHGDLSARLSGRFIREAEAGGHPAVGDWVALDMRLDEGAATVQAVLPRRTAFTRKAADSVQTVQVVAANIDVALLVASMNGDRNGRRLERYLASAWQSGARPVVVLTKADLCADRATALAEAEGVSPGVPVLVVSALTGEGLADVRAQLSAGETAVLVGSSGAGKSTLVNALYGETVMATGAIREDDARGRHTTTHRELILLPGGAMVLDTPGMRELGLLDAQEGLDAAFDDIEALAANCRFSDCGHSNEPGCAIRAALDSGALDASRWKNFRKLRRELAFVERKEDRVAREAERKRWIAISKAQRGARKLRGRD